MKNKKKVAAILCSLSILMNLSVSAMAADQTTDRPVPCHTLLECHDLQAETELQNNGDSAVPYAIVHCESGSEVGRYVEQLVSYEKTGGYETDDCTHSIQGRKHIRYEWVYTYNAYCTLCDHTATFHEMEWGGWQCVDE